MRINTTLLCLCIAAFSGAQNLQRAYDRDSNVDFKLKNVSTKSLVLGPIVKQKTVFTFDNPYTQPSEASVWFSLDWAAVLAGFAYWYKDEYVPGILMDKKKAWFIYTAITSRNEDPGIMTQIRPNAYHAQIFPIAKGYDLRVELNSVAFLEATPKTLQVPFATFGTSNAPYHQEVISAKPETLMTSSDGSSQITTVEYPKVGDQDIQVYAQKFKDGYTYVAGLMRTERPNDRLTISGLHDVLWTRPYDGIKDGSVKLFIGRRRGPGKFQIVSHGDTVLKTSQQIYANERGTDTAKLWAHQKLIQTDFKSRSDVLRLSAKYQIPSKETALLAVPQEEMKLFKKKEAEFRRREAAERRRNRNWQSERYQNWQNTQGGDPELRIFMPEADRVYAILPDGRRFDLQKSTDGYWGGNYDIPADSAEGTYTVRVIGVLKDGSQVENSVQYEVDRTPPDGKLSDEDGFLVLRSEPGLARCTAVFGDGKEDNMVEVEPGVYKLPLKQRRVIKVVLFDKAHNHREILWSS